MKRKVISIRQAKSFPGIESQPDIWAAGIEKVRQNSIAMHEAGELFRQWKRQQVKKPTYPQAMRQFAKFLKQVQDA